MPSRRILIIEDDPDGREMIRELLQLSGHEVYAAADGLVGVSMARQVKPEFVFLDLGLPRLDGVEVAQHLRSFCGESVRIIAVTGRAVADPSSNADFDEYLVKPVDPSMLLQRVSS